MLAYLAGAALFVCAVMGAYWASQRVPPGYGLWTSSCVLIALGCLILAIWPGFPSRVLHLVVCGLVAVAAVLRVEGMWRFLGRQRFVRWPLLLPLVVVALIAVFTYAWNNAPARGMVVGASVALVFWAMAALLVAAAKKSYTLYLRSISGLFVVYGALWLGSGIHWLIKTKGFPTLDIDTQGVVFLVAVTAFEFLWLIGCLIFSTKWSAEALETARGLADSARRQLADIVAFLPDATFALDNRRRIIAWNRAIQEKTGIQAEAILGRPCEEAKTSPLLSRDLEEQKSKSHAVAGYDLATLHSQKLEAVGQLAGGIAHDFNNLLTAIIGYGSLILADENARGLKSLRRDAEEIRNAAERAAALTSQILAFARRQPLRPRKVRLADLVEGIEERMRSLIPDNIQLTVSSSPDAGVVEVDTEQFDRVLMNLVKNACEAMSTGGRLLLRVENAELSEETCLAYPELQAGSYVVLSVSDTGVGMDADTRLRIFEPFFTTKSPGEGAGLGLSVVYGVVRQSGGHVLAYSEVDKGTTLKIYLPRTTGSADAVVSKVAPVVSPGRGGETVLVVEDEPPLRRLVARVLGEGGYRVFVAGTGPEALELLEDMEEPPDLLITDVVLPGGLQGNELASAFVAKVPDLPVLYMSGHPRDAIVHAGRLDDGVAFLGKPFTPQGLAYKVREVLDSHPDSF
jgi:signal transduction histidine kinase